VAYVGDLCLGRACGLGKNEGHGVSWKYDKKKNSIHRGPSRVLAQHSGLLENGRMVAFMQGKQLQALAYATHQ